MASEFSGLQVFATSSSASNFQVGLKGQYPSTQVALKVVLLNLSWGQIKVGPSWLSLLQAEIKMSKDAPLSKVFFSSKHKMHQIQRTTSVQIQVYSYLLNPTRLKMKFKMRDKIQMQEQSKSNLWNTAQVKMETQAFPGAAHSEMFILFKLFQRKCLHICRYTCRKP